MPVHYWTVIKFNPGSNFGFARIEGTETVVLVHKKQKCKVVWTGPAPYDLDFQPDAPHAPEIGNKLVLDTVPTDKGGRAIAWAFRQEWDTARPPAPTPMPANVPDQSPPEPASVPVAPRVEQPLTVKETLETLDFRFLHAVLDALENEELAIAQLQNFVRNTPKGKRGEALWDAFHKRKANSHDKKYGIAAFIKQVLEEAGFIVS